MFYEIMSNHKDPVYTPRELYQRMKGSVLCEYCNAILRTMYPIPYDIILGNNPSVGHRISGFVTHSNINIYHIDFILQIKHYLDYYGFIIGKCFNENDELIPNYVTCYHKSYIVRRGKDIKYKVCGHCRSVRYYPLWGDNQYFTKSEVKDMKVIQDLSGGIHLTQDVFENIDFSLWSDCKFISTEVLDVEPDSCEFPCTTDY